MKTIQILEDNDEITGNEYVRAIDFVWHETPGCNSFSTYGGRPENNTLWVPFSDVFGTWCIGYTVGELREKMKGYRYEFALGEMPVSNVWVNWRKERKELIGE